MQDVAKTDHREIEKDTREVWEKNKIGKGEEQRQQRDQEVRKNHLKIGDIIEKTQGEDRIGKGENEDHRMVPDLIARQKKEGEKT